MWPEGGYAKIPRPLEFARHVEVEGVEAQKPTGATLNEEPNTAL